MQVIKEFESKIIKNIKENKIESVELPGEKNPKPFPVNPGSNVSKIFNKEACNKCNICGRECPVNAINIDTMEIDEIYV